LALPGVGLVCMPVSGQMNYLTALLPRSAPLSPMWVRRIQSEEVIQSDLGL